MDKLDLTSSRVLKGSMKFTPKIGKKDKSKKTKKTSKNITQDNNKKISKKHTVTKKITDTNEQKKNEIVDLENNSIGNNGISNESLINKSVTVNTIKSKTLTENTKNLLTSSKSKANQTKTSNNKISVSKDKTPTKTSSHVVPVLKDISKTKNNTILGNKKGKNIKENISKSVSTKSTKLTELKNQKEINQNISIEEDTISEISDDISRTQSIVLKDSIEESNSDTEIITVLEKKKIVTEEETLIEEGENSDTSVRGNSSEIADETLIIEDTQRILETDEEEIRKIPNKDTSSSKECNTEKTQHQEVNNINSDIQELIKVILKDDKQGKSKSKKSKKEEKSLENFISGLITEDQTNTKESNLELQAERQANDSIYELLDQEDFNQSIDAENYNKPIHHEDAEIEKIVKEKITTSKRKVGRPSKKTKAKKTTKKPVEVIVISDDEDDDQIVNKPKVVEKTVTIKKEVEEDTSMKIKEENIESQQSISKTSNKRSTREEMESGRDELQGRKAKRQRTTKKGNQTLHDSEDENNDENEQTVIAQEKSHTVLEKEVETSVEAAEEEEEEGIEREVEEENIEIHEREKEKKSKKEKSSKAKSIKSPKSTKVSKSPKSSKSSKSKTIAESESEPSESEEATTQKTRSPSKKRKMPSPTKKTNKKKKLVHSEDGNPSSDSEESDNISIASRTIADIIDNYRGTEISTTQKEIYRLAALKRKATLERKRGRLSTPEITTQTMTTPEKPKEETGEKKPKLYDPEKNKTAIQMRVVNGEIVIDQRSTLIDHIDTTDEALPMLKYDENNHVTSASFKQKLKPLKWTKDETELFYKCLSIFGTNFSMLAIMFPTRNRKQLLNKYKNEEKVNPGHVQYALKHKMALDPEFFEKYSGQNMMEIGREAVEKVRLIEEQRKKEDMELFNLKKKENDNEIKKVIIKNEQLYSSDVKDVKPILAN